MTKPNSHVSPRADRAWEQQCCVCRSTLSPGEELYCVNPPGGYGKPGIWVHADPKCLHADDDVYTRLESLGLLEEKDRK